jgi:glucose/arabinose dehydrogenase
MRTFSAWACAGALTGAALLTALPIGAADAQTPNTQNAQPQSPSAKPDQKGANGEPLTEKLDKNEGVLTPPSGVDPKMHKEPPGEVGDKMPIIIPPGEPGGDQSIQPK